MELHEAWLRIEHQSFVALPESQGVLFAIRLVVRSLLEIKSEPEIVAPLMRALRTMPEEMARYKNIHTARGRLLQLLSEPTKYERD